MSTVEIARARPLRGGPERAAVASASRAGSALLLALLALTTYAAFDHGAIGVAAGARLQVAVSALAAAAAAGWLWTGALRLAAPRLATAGVGALTAFAVWSGVTVLWSVAPDQTWLELNRALTYVLLLGLGIVVGASFERALELLVRGLVVVELAVTVYALAHKVVPGLVGVGQAQFVPRLQEPFGYWNALGLFIVFGVPPGLALATDPERATRERLGALLSVVVMLLAIGLTYSRGAVLALVVALIIWVSLSGARLRSLLWLFLACVATVPSLVFGLTVHDLTTVSASLSARELAGAELTAVLVASLAALWFVGRRVIDQGQRVRISPQRAYRIGRSLALLAGASLACALIAVALSSRGLPGTASHAWKSFTTTRTTSNYNPTRLLSADSENRWVWWKEAAGAFSAKPLRGWGAGSFGVVHLLYRRDTTSVMQPHSVPLQFLAETGIIGALLALGAYGAFVATGIRTVRRRVGGRDRLLAAASLAGVVAYGIHALYDWDWDIPGVTLPALLLAGLLAGLASGGRQEAPARGSPGPAARLLGLAASTVLLAAIAFSGVVPSVAAGDANTALVDASSSSPSTLARAQADATAASRLDPLSDAGLLASATIAFHRGQLAQGREYVLRAIKRDPEDVQAWNDLESAEFGLGDFPVAIAAIERAVQLDPKGSEARRFARLAELILTPPIDSATARQTPGG
jgi:hypothetical protein